MPVERLYIFCEGQTKENFCNEVLSPHFRVLGVADVRPLLFPNKPKSNLRLHKGGWIRYDLARRYMLRVMAEQHRPNTWFTTMVDLYAIPSDFPGLADAPVMPPRSRVQALERAMESDIRGTGYYRFTAHLQLHEYEALLLSDCAAIEAFFPAMVGLAEELRRDIGSLEPEDVDEGPMSAPSKRIIRHAPEYKGLKTVAGPVIALHIGLPALRQRCPHFGAWIDGLERSIS